VSSTVPSPSIPQHGSVPHQPNALRRNRSFASIKEPEHQYQEKGFAKFLAAKRADWQGHKGHKDVAETVRAGVGEGWEVQRDGYGEWRRLVIDDERGAGLSPTSVDVGL
jgi:hypothetical protein